MTGYTSGFVEAGVASNNSMTYVTLDVRPGENVGTVAPRNSAPVTPIPIQPLLTATPRIDGSIVHVVGNGQSLWSIAIAYGVKINDIRSLNNLAPDETTIYAGQKLLICLSCPVKPVPSDTPILSPMPTMLLAMATPTPLPSATTTVSPTLVATKAPSSQDLTLSKIQFWLILLVVLCLGGLQAFGISRLRK